MSKLPADAAAVNARFITGRRVPAPDRSADTLPAPLPASLDPDAMRRIARLWQAVRWLDAERRANDPTVIGQEFLARRVAVAELAQRIEREGWDAVVNPPPPAPQTFTELAFAAWWNAIARLGLIDGDALLLAWCIWIRLPRPNQDNVAAAFLEEMAALDPEANAEAYLAALHSVRALRVQPAPTRGRGRPKRRQKAAEAKDLAQARKLFAKRQAEGLLMIPNVDPWHLLGQLGDFIDGIIATDHGVSNSDDLQDLAQELGSSKSSLKQAWLGSASRQPGLPSLRRRLVIEALADHCLKWWLNEAAREAGPFAN